jgi:hypothetical protein
MNSSDLQIRCGMGEQKRREQTMVHCALRKVLRESGSRGQNRRESVEKSVGGSWC